MVREISVVDVETSLNRHSISGKELLAGEMIVTNKDWPVFKEAG